MGLQEVAVKAAATTLATERGRHEGATAPHTGSDPTRTQEWPESQQWSGFLGQELPMGEVGPVFDMEDMWGPQEDGNSASP